MVNRIIKLLIVSVAITIVLIILLFITKEYSLNYIYEIIMSFRNSGNLEGETLAVELITILFCYIIPSIFILILAYVSKFKPFNRFLKY